MGRFSGAAENFSAFDGRKREGKARKKRPVSHGWAAGRFGVFQARRGARERKLFPARGNVSSIARFFAQFNQKFTQT